MPPQISAKRLLRILEEHGFCFVSQKGSHIKVRKISDNESITVIVPNHASLKTGTLLNIMRRAKLSRKDLM